MLARREIVWRPPPRPQLPPASETPRRARGCIVERASARDVGTLRAPDDSTMSSMSHTHVENLAVGGASSPKQRDESTRFDPVAFENDRAVRPHIEHIDRLQTLNVDAEILASELKRAIKGEVRFD